MKSKFDILGVSKKVARKLPSLSWSKKDKMPSFLIFALLLVLLFVYLWNLKAETVTDRSYDAAVLYSNEYIHIDVDLLSNTTTTRGLSGHRTMHGSPYHMIIYAMPDVDPEYEEFHQKDMDAFVAQKPYEKIMEAKLKDVRMVTAYNELILELGDIDLLSGSEIVLDGDAHPLDITFLNKFSKDETKSKYVKGRIDLGKFDLNYEGYLVEGTLQMETIDGPVERHFIIGLVPLGETTGVDSVTLTEVQLPFFFGFLPMALLMAAFIALVMKLITRVSYSIALKIQLILYLLAFFDVHTVGLWYPDQRWNTVLTLIFIIILQTILYKKYSKRGYALIIIGTILAPVMFYYSFNFIGDLLI